MTRFRKKAIEVEAVQWTGENRAEVEAFAGNCSLVFSERSRIRMWCGLAEVGDYIYRDEGGSWCFKPAVTFEATYEPAPAPLQKDGGEGLEAEFREKLIEIRDEAALVLHEESDPFETCVLIEQIAAGAVRKGGGNRG